MKPTALLVRGAPFTEGRELIRSCSKGLGLKTTSEPHGYARADLPQRPFDVLDPSLRVLKLDFKRFGYFFIVFGGHRVVLENHYKALIRTLYIYS